MTKKRKIPGKIGAVFVAAALLLLCAVPSAALPAEGDAVQISPTPSGVSDHRLASHPAVAVVRGGERICTGRLVDGWATVPLRFFCDAVLPGCNVSYTSKTRTMTVTAPGLFLSATDGDFVVSVNGRCFYSDLPAVILDDGRMYVSAWVMAKATGLWAGWNASTRTLTFGGSVRFPQSGSTFYDPDVLYWLSRIISAESRGEPFVGQIAVGNVVLNRVRSAEFPGTVYGVIFDRKYGTQFTPVANGTVYAPPASSAVTAAKVCLEGYTVSPSALYFLNPKTAASFWITGNRPYLFRIGNHAFYR